MKYKVREHFFVHLDGKVLEPGTELELTDEQAERHAAQIEPVEAPKPARKVKADGDQ
jgi:hypothetical protein